MPTSPAPSPRLRILPIWLAALCTVAAIAACGDPPCATSNACRDVDAQTECVVTDVAAPAESAQCLVTASDRTPLNCDTVSDCDGFPVEATCDAGLCKCPDLECEGAYSVVHCLCFGSDGELDAICFDNDDCNGDMTCFENACTNVPQIGSACGNNEECAGGPELYTCISDTCRQLPDDNGVCDDNGDCRIRPTDRCVNGQCHTNGGQPGERCFGDADCFTEICNPDFGTCD